MAMFKKKSDSSQTTEISRTVNSSSFSDGHAVPQTTSDSDSSEYIRIRVIDPSRIVTNLSFGLDPMPGIKDAKIELCKSSQSGDVCYYVIGVLCRKVRNFTEHPCNPLTV